MGILRSSSAKAAIPGRMATWLTIRSPLVPAIISLARPVAIRHRRRATEGGGVTANGGLGKLRRKRAGVDIRVVEPARRSAVRLSRADVHQMFSRQP